MLVVNLKSQTAVVNIPVSQLCGHKEYQIAIIHHSGHDKSQTGKGANDRATAGSTGNDGAMPNHEP